MKLTNLEPASDCEVEEWFEKAVNMTPYQKEKFRNDEVIRFSKYEFYKRRKKEKVTIIWRLSIFLIPIYLLLVYLCLPFNLVLTGKWGYGQKFYDNFHAKWMNKLNL